MPKKIKGPIIPHLGANQFCQTWEKISKECAHGLQVNANADYYTLLYQNGKFLGLVQPDGGAIYPFSTVIYKKGSRFKNKKILSAKVVSISSSYNLKMLWGTKDQILIYDRDGKPCWFGAGGTLFLELDPGDNGRNADCLYHKLFSQGDPDTMTVEAVQEKLRPAFSMKISEQIQECLESMNRPLDQLAGLTPKEKLEVSRMAYDALKGFFREQYGLTLAPASKNSIVERLIVIGKEPEKTATPINTGSSHFSPSIW